MNTSSLLLLLAMVPAEPKSEPVVELRDYAPCGIVSLYLVAHMRQSPATFEQVKELVGPPDEDSTHSFETISTAARKLGLHPVGMRATPESLRQLPMPAIAQVRDARRPEEPPHLLVLLGVKSDGVSLLDAPYPAYFLPAERFEQSWTGNLLVFAETEQQAAGLKQVNPAWLPLGLLVSGFVAVGIIGVVVWRQRLIHGLSLLHRMSLYRPRTALALLLIALVSVGAGGFWWFGSPSQVKAAECVFERPSLALGELTPGEAIAQVVIRNPGDRPLEVASVESTCACASVRPPANVPPRSSAMMEVTLNVNHGPGSARLIVTSNDPVGPKHVVISWQGSGEPTLYPFWIKDTDQPSNRPYERTLTLRFPGGKSSQTPQLQRVECPSDAVTIEAGKVALDARRYGTSAGVIHVIGEMELRLRIQPTADTETLNTTVTLQVKHGSVEKSISLPISVQFINPAIVPDISSAVFSGRSPSELRETTRTVRLKKGAGVGDLGIEGVPDWLDCTISPQPEKDSVLNIRFRSNPPAGQSAATLFLVDTRDRTRRVPFTVRTFVPETR